MVKLKMELEDQVRQDRCKCHLHDELVKENMSLRDEVAKLKRQLF